MRPALPARALALVLSMVAAGCVAPAATPATSEPPTAASPVAFLFRCLADGAWQAEPCISRISRSDATLQEPFVAVDPRNADVLAVGVNLGPSLVERATGLLTQDSWTCRLGVFLSEDGGASWRETFAPTPTITVGPLGPHPDSCAGDPALVFDEHGRLHVTGIATRGVAPGPASALVGDGLGYVTYYVRTDDLGATWEDAAIVSENGMSQDRNWMAWDVERQNLYVVWQNTEGAFSEWTLEMAWSEDRGATWRNQAGEQTLNCGTPGRPVLRDGEVLVSCASMDSEGRTRLTVATFDPATGAMGIRAALPVGGWWGYLTLLPDGGLVLAYETAAGPELLRSSDGGHTWGDLAVLTDLVKAGPGDAHIYWYEADPQGGMHLLVGFRRVDAAAPTSRVPPAAENELRHVVLGDGWKVLSETTLDAWRTPMDSTPRPAMTLGDHYYGMAWTGKGMILTWTRDAAIGLAEIAPKAS